MNQLEQMQALQVIQMMQAMPGQEIIVNCPNEDAAEQFYKHVMEVIKANTHVDQSA